MVILTSIIILNIIIGPETPELALHSRGKRLHTPEITKVELNWKIPLNIHWTIPVKTHWGSDNPLEHTTEK